MERVAFDGGFERGVVEGVVDGNDVRGGFAGSKYRFYPVESSHERYFFEMGRSLLCGRYNGQRAMRAQCNNALGYTAESARALIAEKVDTITLPEGYAKQWLGEHKASGGVHEIFVREYSVSCYSDDVQY